MRLWRVCCWLVCLALAPLAQAQTKLELDELLQIAWESTWGQSGAPLPIIKWTGPLRLRLQGDRMPQRQQMVIAMLDELVQITGLRYEVVTDVALPVQAIIDVVTESSVLSDSTPCLTSYQSDGNGLKSAHVSVRDRVIGHCLMHELGHLLGVAGHPMGSTVMTYFGGIRALTDYDKYLLRLRYSKAVPHGTSPFAFVKIAGEQWIASLPSPEDQERAKQQLQGYLSALNEEMTAYATGRGEPPRVLYRAGRLRPEAVERGRTTMQVFLGMSYFLGHLAPVEHAKALPFFQLAADAGHPGAQFMLGVLYRGADPSVRDLTLAHQWLACSARNGLAAAQSALATLEQQVAPEVKEAMRAATKAAMEQGLCKQQAPAA